MAGTTVKARQTGMVGSDVRELRLSHNLIVGEVDTTNTNNNTLADEIDYAVNRDGVMGGDYAFATAAAVTIACTGGVQYRLNGNEYFGQLPATLTLEDPGDVTQNNFIAWRVEIDALGATTSKACALAGGYSTAEKALLALGAVARTANTVVLGFMTATDSNSVINIGTDNTNASGVTYTFYYQKRPKVTTTGLNAALGTAAAGTTTGPLTLTTASTTFNTGTIDVNVLGLKKAQIAAITTQAMTDADVISTVKVGSVLFLTNLAGTGVVTLNQAGLPGVQTMASVSVAASVALISTLVDRLPGMFCPIGYVTVSNASGGNFTFKTTNWDAASMSCTPTSATFGTWSRLATSGFDANQITRAAIPAVVSQTAYKVADFDGNTT